MLPSALEGSLKHKLIKAASGQDVVHGFQLLPVLEIMLEIMLARLVREIWNWTERENVGVSWRHETVVVRRGKQIITMFFAT